jgi:hypothetical protein
MASPSGRPSALQDDHYTPSLPSLKATSALTSQLNHISSSSLFASKGNMPLPRSVAQKHDREKEETRHNTLKPDTRDSGAPPTSGRKNVGTGSVYSERRDFFPTRTHSTKRRLVGPDILHIANQVNPAFHCASAKNNALHAGDLAESVT